jgi:hypothetical protein
MNLPIYFYEWFLEEQLKELLFFSGFPEMCIFIHRHIKNKKKKYGKL